MNIKYMITYRLAGMISYVRTIRVGEDDRVRFGDGIVKLHLGFGTNAFSVKYYNVYDKTVSDEYNP